MATPLNYPWEKSKIARFPMVKSFLDKKGLLSGSAVWDRQCSSPALGEFLANRLGDGAKGHKTARVAFHLLLTGELDSYQLDSGKNISRDRVLALMLGRDLNSTGSAPPVGNTTDGEFPWFSKFRTENTALFRALDSALMHVGGYIRPYSASHRADPTKRILLAETEKLIKANDEVVARIENYALDRQPRSLPTPKPAAPLLLAHKESAKQRKARKQRERRDAIKAAKLTK